MEKTINIVINESNALRVARVLRRAWRDKMFYRNMADAALLLGLAQQIEARILPMAETMESLEDIKTELISAGILTVRVK